MPTGPNIKKLSNTGMILEMLSNEIDHDREYSNLFKYTKDDTGIRSNTSNARLKLFKDGDIELLTTDEMGLYISGKYKSTSLNSEFAHIHSNKVMMNTDEDGLMWNGYYVNPVLRAMCDDRWNMKIVAIDKDKNTFEISPFIKINKKSDNKIREVARDKGEFYNSDLDDGDLMNHIINITNINDTEYEFYKEEE